MSTTNFPDWHGCQMIYKPHDTEMELHIHQYSHFLVFLCQQVGFGPGVLMNMGSADFSSWLWRKGIYRPQDTEI